MVFTALFGAMPAAAAPKVDHYQRVPIEFRNDQLFTDRMKTLILLAALIEMMRLRVVEFDADWADVFASIAPPSSISGDLGIDRTPQ